LVTPLRIGRRGRGRADATDLGAMRAASRRRTTRNNTMATIQGTAGNDAKEGTAGADLILLLDGNDAGFNLGGNDTVFGGNGDDELLGGLGDDAPIGGAGDGTLFGNAGADRFVYQSTADSGLGSGTRDVIEDFARGQDPIDLPAIDANVNASGSQAFASIGGAAFSGVAGRMRTFVPFGNGDPASRWTWTATAGRT
jgi:Ca2+-binding RTX toxin-like protein